MAFRRRATLSALSMYVVAYPPIHLDLSVANAKDLQACYLRDHFDTIRHRETRPSSRRSAVLKGAVVTGCTSRNVLGTCGGVPLCSVGEPQAEATKATSNFAGRRFRRESPITAILLAALTLALV